MKYTEAQMQRVRNDRDRYRELYLRAKNELAGWREHFVILDEPQGEPDWGIDRELS